MNKNTRQRLKEYRAQCKKSGHWPTKGFKARKRPYPKIRRDDANT